MRDLFAPLDTARLPASAADSVRMHLFPNPSNGVLHIASHATDSVNLKVVLVDRARTALFRFSYNGSAISTVSFDWRAAVPAADSQARVYFAYSTAAAPYFYTSHADITVRR